jgi:ribosome biogenesis GTPase
METGELSEKIRRGKHTTRHVQLLDCGEETYVCDTPGFSSLDLPELTPEQLQYYFEEFEPFVKDCRFKGCVHMEEPVCGVKAAVKQGLIHAQRYENYRLFYEDLKNRRRY